MKHLKKYNESVEEPTLQDVRDILLELEDEGFTAKIHRLKSQNVLKILIKKTKLECYKYQDVKETLLRLKDYLGEKIRYISVSIDPNNIWANWEVYEVIMFNEDELLGRKDGKVHDFHDHDIDTIEIYFTYEVLKKYNENAEEKTLEEDVNDILLELKDDGFMVRYCKETNYEYHYVLYSINFGKTGKIQFVYDDVKEVLLRLKDYLYPNELFIMFRDLSGQEYMRCEFDENYIQGKVGYLMKKVDITKTPLIHAKIRFKLKNETSKEI